MQKNPEIAIIIPAYNAEKYIEKALQSILGQSYADIEITVVDDGSTDNTAALVADIAAKDHRVKLLSIANGGPANARNKGLEAVKGTADYIAFCDADDELLPDALEKALAAAESGSDMVLFGFTIINPDGSRNDYFEPDGVYTSNNLGTALADLYKANLLNQVWAKLFRAELIYNNNITFQNYRWGEDRLFIFDCVEHSEQISVISYCGYHYLMYNSSSLITGFYDKKATVCAIADIRAQELCAKYGVTDDSYFRYMFAKSIISCMTNMFSPTCHMSRSEKRSYIKYIITNDYIQERCRCSSGGAAVKVLTGIMRTRNISLNMFAARAVAAAGKISPKLFQLIKHKK